MPRVFVPKKDVQGCVKPRSDAKSRYQSGISEWGNLILSNLRLPIIEYSTFG